MIGDVWCIFAAVASAMFILRLEKHSRENDAAELSGVSFSAVTVLCGVWVWGDYMKGSGLGDATMADSFNDNALSGTISGTITDTIADTFTAASDGLRSISPSFDASQGPAGFDITAAQSAVTQFLEVTLPSFFFFSRV